MTNFSTITLEDLALVIGGATTDISGDGGGFSGKIHHESDPPPPPDSEAYLRCRKQTYDESPLYDQWFRPNRIARLQERACSGYRPH